MVSGVGGRESALSLDPFAVAVSKVSCLERTMAKLVSGDFTSFEGLCLCLFCLRVKVALSECFGNT